MTFKVGDIVRHPQHPEDWAVILVEKGGAVHLLPVDSSIKTYMRLLPSVMGPLEKVGVLKYRASNAYPAQTFCFNDLWQVFDKERNSYHAVADQLEFPLFFLDAVNNVWRVEENNS